MTKRLLIITDSLGAPRSTPELVEYEQTWPYIVKRHFELHGYDVFIFTENGLDSNMLLGHCEFKMALYNASVVITQVGIVDCAPRALTKREIALLNVLHLSRLVQPIISKKHALISKKRNLTYTSIHRFRENIQKVDLLFKNKGSNVYFVEIGAPNNRFILKSPAISNNVAAYNDVFRTVGVNLLEYSDAMRESIYMQDNHHLNIVGHNLLAQKILDELDEYNNEI